MRQYELPVAVIGAGPVGLAAAAHLHQRGEPFVVLEAAPQIAGNVATWAHVRIFSPWRYCIDSAARDILLQNGWSEPDLEHLPTGAQLIDHYLHPLGDSPQLTPHIRLNAKVTAISRSQTDKMQDVGRDDRPFVLHIETPDGTERIQAKAVIDASGTWGNLAPMGADGLHAQGEQAAHGRIRYGIPDVLGSERSHYQQKRVAVVGGGHSAINAILDLSELADEAAKSEIFWILRKPYDAGTFGNTEDDELPARGMLGSRVARLVKQGRVRVVAPFWIDSVEALDKGIRLRGASESETQELLVDEVIVATGTRPDLNMLRELRLALDPSVESPVSLAPLIDPNIHSCGTVPPHGERELRHPEQNFYMVGMKSYGRAPTFLMLAGYEQVRSVVAYIAGDFKAAAQVELELPATGVCGVPSSRGPELIQIGTSQQKSHSCC